MLTRDGYDGGGGTCNSAHQVDHRPSPAEKREAVARLVPVASPKLGFELLVREGERDKLPPEILQEAQLRVHRNRPSRTLPPLPPLQFEPHSLHPACSSPSGCLHLPVCVYTSSALSVLAIASCRWATQGSETTLARAHEHQQPPGALGFARLEQRGGGGQAATPILNMKLVT